MSSTRVSRRKLLSAGALLGSSAALGIKPADATSYSGQVPWSPGEANAPSSFTPGALQFFTPDEALFIDAAVARLIPADELGPGAKEAGVTVFLDRQLAGPYGRGQTWYMQGPWREGEKTQGYQSRLTPAQLYRSAIKSIDDHCRKQFDGKPFHQLAIEQQDKVLTGLEKGEIKLEDLGPHAVEIEGSKSDTFFAQFLQNTMEGFFSDPIYAGNKDMAGWKLIGFPGARYDYRAYVSKHGEKLNLAPVGIKGRPGWHPNG
jgi:gluconate 2-dehydrogenase gamma chain